MSLADLPGQDLFAANWPEGQKEPEPPITPSFAGTESEEKKGVK